MVRASDAERDEVIGRLREEFAAGRLSHDTFLFRMSTVLQARHQSDLPRMLADLPARPVSASVLASVVGRLRAALPWRARTGAVQSGAQSGPAQSGPAQPDGVVPRTAAPRVRPARRLTNGMPLASAHARPPVPLEFPRGERTLFSIGRDAQCDLAIADMTVSRFHARLERTADGWLLTDLGSTNGTRVNGWRVRDQVPVRAGDLLRFGEAEYCLSAAAGI